MLCALVPSPDTPVGAGSDALWRDLANTFNFPFPNSFRSLIDVYGSGGFFDEIGIVSPFSPYRSFVEWHEDNLANSYPDIFRTFRSGADEGLLQIGGDSNGGTLFLLLKDGDASTLVYANREQDEMHIDRNGIASYLFSIADGQQFPPSYGPNNPLLSKRTFVPDKPSIVR